MRKGREADCDVVVPPVPEAPGAGPLPKYARGGRKEVDGDGKKGRRRMDRTHRAKGGKTDKWIQSTGVDKPGHKGALHRALGVPEGEKIPAKKLAKAEHSNNPHMQHMAQFAKNVKGLG